MFQTRFATDGLDALLVTHPANVFSLSNFKGSAGMLLVTPEGVSQMSHLPQVFLLFSLLLFMEYKHEKQ